MYAIGAKEKENGEEPALSKAAFAGAHDMKEKDIVDEIEFKASLPLREVKRIVGRKLVKGTAFLCSIYSVHLRNLSKKRELGVEKDLSKKVDFNRADPLCSVRRD